MTPTIQKLSFEEASETSDNITLILKGVQCVTDNFRKPDIIFGVDLGQSKWVLGTMLPEKKRTQVITGTGKAGQLIDLVFKEMARNHVSATRHAVLCFEIGADGTWLRDALNDAGIPCVVLSPDVLCGGGRPKTDKLDAIGLCTHLCHFYDRELDPNHVHMPLSVVQQVSRCVCRFRKDMIDGRTEYGNKFRSLLKRYMELPSGLSVGTVDVSSLRDYRGRPLPDEIVYELEEFQDLYKVFDMKARAQDAKMNMHLKDAVRDARGGLALAESDRNLLKLMRVKGVGLKTAWVLQSELFSRRYVTTGQVSAATGLVDTPRSSGGSERSGGISRRSNSRLRAALVELAWLWRRHQPGSAITEWFNMRTANGVAHKRMKKVAVVGMARRIAVALWKYLVADMPIEGAVMKAVS